MQVGEVEATTTIPDEHKHWRGFVGTGVGGGGGYTWHGYTQLLPTFLREPRFGSPPPVHLLCTFGYKLATTHLPPLPIPMGCARV